MRRRSIIRAVSAALITAAVPLSVATTGAFASFVPDDFSNGTHDGTVVVGGHVQLSSPVDTTFDGTALPTGWSATQWNPPAGGATVSGGALSVDGARADSNVTTGPGSVLDFRATFGAQSFQHVGFGTGFEQQPWAMFSTGKQDGPTIYARTFAPSAAESIDTPIPNIAVDQTHDYRIAWTDTGFDYYVDDVLVHHDDAVITSQMQPQASDFGTGTPLTVESMKLTPTPGTYTSPVLDGGTGFITGITLHTTATVPDGTSITYETRSGSTSTPDDSWSAWAPVAADGTVASPTARYLQYRAILTTNSTLATPVLTAAAVDFAVDNQGPATSVTGVAVSGTTATATFTSDDSAATYECSLDGGAFASCTSPATFAGLSAGTHTLAVRGTDAHGNAGAVVSREFVIPGAPASDGSGGSGGSVGVSPGHAHSPSDTVAPRVVITPKSVRLTRSGRATVKVKCPRSETRCKVTVRLKLEGKTVAKKTVAMRGGKTVKVSLKVSLWARTKLAKHRALKVTATATATDAAGNVKVTSSRITLKPALHRR